MKNHLGSYECKLCLTLHNNEVGFQCLLFARPLLSLQKASLAGCAAPTHPPGSCLVSLTCHSEHGQGRRCSDKGLPLIPDHFFTEHNFKCVFLGGYSK